MNKNNKFIKILKKGCAVYLVHKFMSSEVHWVKRADGTYGEFSLVTKLDDPLSKVIMNKVAKLYDYGIEYLKKEI